VAAPPAPYRLRPPEQDDLTWVVQRQSELYAQDFGWNAEFEAECATIVADYARDHDPERERCWIAEKDGATIGCIFLMRRSAQQGQLRMLLVEPSARGLGVGRHLVQECIRGARECGYRSLMLWTTSRLAAARRIYEREGFRLVKEEPQRIFGDDLVGEEWELDL